jgi:hypothetical protein|tara:strand:- start:190 stop:318 length:129 start_codon:yes stop_codon:yes gene_type:complete
VQLASRSAYRHRILVDIEVVTAKEVKEGHGVQIELLNELDLI